MNVHSPAFQADLAQYNASMERSLEDKLFFLEHTAGAMTFVDFGCANGAVLKAVSERRPNKTLIGIDINPMQLAIAGQKVPGGVFVEDFELVRERLEGDNLGPKVAIFSSVLHESMKIFEEPLKSGIFDYIAIRDMGITSGFADSETPASWVDKVARHAPNQLRDYVEERDGIIHLLGGLTEFLLKFPYLGHSEVQTKRELGEDYPLVGVENLTDGADRAYAPILYQHYSAPWVVDRIRQDFGFEFPYPTHFKMILKKVTL